MFFENYEFYVDVQYTGLCVFMESIERFSKHDMKMA